MGYKPKKRDLITTICFNEYDNTTSIVTCNTGFKKRLYSYSQQYPELCKVIDDDDECVEFEIVKDRIYQLFKGIYRRYGLKGYTFIAHTDSDK